MYFINLTSPINAPEYYHFQIVISTLKAEHLKAKIISPPITIFGVLILELKVSIHSKSLQFGSEQNNLTHKTP